MNRTIHAIVFCLLLGTGRQALAQRGQITLGQSAQTITLTSLGPDSSGNGQSRLTWNSCSFDGTNTSCTLSGPFTGLGPGGTWDLALTYPGNGPSPVTAITAPGSDFYTVTWSSGSVTWVFNESNGTTVTFYYLTGSIFFVQGQFSCTGNPTSCDPGTVGQTLGTTETGPVNGSFNPLPQIQTVITAGSYGGSASIAPATWIEIYGLNVGTTRRYVWAGSDFHGSDAPTALAGTTVTVGGQLAYVDYVSPGQVNAQVPSNIGTGQQPVIVTTAGGSSDPFNVNVNSTQPGFLAPPAFDIKGTQYVVALYPNQLYVLPGGAIPGLASKRALPGDTILLYGVGFGGVSDGTLAGVIDAGQNQVNSSLKISIGGATAQIAYAGLTPGFVGLYQINVVVPNISPSDQAPLTFTLDGTPGTQTLYLAIGG
jgi:uncharacterized protein (TIGR03437 family)